MPGFTIHFAVVTHFCRLEVVSLRRTDGTTQFVTHTAITTIVRVTTTGVGAAVTAEADPTAAVAAALAEEEAPVAADPVVAALAEAAGPINLLLHRQCRQGQVDRRAVRIVKGQRRLAGLRRFKRLVASREAPSAD